jgi:two-component SAPR family response regulator
MVWNCHVIPEKTRVIFTSAFKEYALDSYEVNAIDFLLKPIHYSKFLSAVEKAQKWFELSSAQDKAPRNGNTIFINVNGMVATNRPSKDRVYLWNEGLCEYLH